MINSASLFGTEIENSPFSSVPDDVPVDVTDIETRLRGKPVPDSITIPVTTSSGVCAVRGCIKKLRTNKLIRDKQVEYEYFFVISKLCLINEQVLN